MSERPTSARRRDHLRVVSRPRRAARAPAPALASRAPRRAAVHRRASGERAVVQGAAPRAGGARRAARARRRPRQRVRAQADQRADEHRDGAAVGARHPAAAPVRASFAGYLGSSSGSQSAQFRAIEAASGLREPQFLAALAEHGDPPEIVSAWLARPTLQELFERLLAAAGRDARSGVRGPGTVSPSAAGREPARVRAVVCAVAVSARAAGRADHRAADWRDRWHARRQVSPAHRVAAILPEALGGARALFRLRCRRGARGERAGHLHRHGRTIRRNGRATSPSRAGGRCGLRLAEASTSRRSRRVRTSGLTPTRRCMCGTDVRRRTSCRSRRSPAAPSCAQSMPRSTRVGLRDLALAATGGRVERLLLRTQCSVAAGRFPDRWPVLTVAVVRALVDRGLKLLGVDTPSVDARHSKTLEVHHALFDGGRVQSREPGPAIRRGRRVRARRVPGASRGRGRGAGAGGAEGGR